MLEQVVIWILTILVVPVYYVLQLFSDILHLFGNFCSSTAEDILEATADFVDFIFRRK